MRNNRLITKNQGTVTSDMSFTDKSQIPLDFPGHDIPQFDDFVLGRNELSVGTLRRLLHSKSFHLAYLWGDSGVGVSYLLQASVNEVQRLGNNAVYVSMADIANGKLWLFDTASSSDVVALDDLSVIQGNPDLQEALFHFYNYGIHNAQF